MMDYATVYREIIKENIDYDIVMSGDNWNDKALYNELFELICEVVYMKQETVQIGRKNYPYELVKARFLKLNQSHLEYVINSIRNTPNKISNIKAYMLTALFNAFSTIGHYYMQKVQCDLHNQAMSDIQ